MANEPIKLSQMDVVRALGVTKNAVWYWVHGQRKPGAWAREQMKEKGIVFDGKVFTKEKAA